VGDATAPAGPRCVGGRGSRVGVAVAARGQVRRLGPAGLSGIPVRAPDARPPAAGEQLRPGHRPPRRALREPPGLPATLRGVHGVPDA
jgi:hypothetical protein